MEMIPPHQVFTQHLQATGPPNPQNAQEVPPAPFSPMNPGPFAFHSSPSLFSDSPGSPTISSTISFFTQATLES